MAAISSDSPITLLPPQHSGPSDRKYLLILLAILAIFYGLLIGPHLSAGPDTSYYISIARSILNGRGFEFNGKAVGRAPPGWPLVLAGAMKVSSSFVFLGALNTALLMVSAGFWYRILRRLMTPGRALASMLICGGLFLW